MLAVNYQKLGFQGQFVQLGVGKLLCNTRTDFDVFIKVDDQFILYGGPGYLWEREEITGLLRRGFDTLFVRSRDASLIRVYESIGRLPDINRNLPPRERINSINDVAAKFLNYLYTEEITQACVEKAKDVTSSLVNCISEDRKAIAFLRDLDDHDTYTYQHSVRVSSYAVAIACELGLVQEDCLANLALGGLFHDIGKKAVPLDVINKKGALTDLEWKLMRNHPRQGGRYVAETGLGHVSREIVEHHHEKNDGSGYPDGLGLHEILLEVQIASLADVFDALTSERAYQKRRTKFEALDLIKSKMLGAELSQDPFRALISCLSG